MKNKKADLSINMIIIAVIALIVLIVLAVIFTGKFKIFGEGVSKEASKVSSDKCEVPGARQCVTGEEECGSLGGRIASEFSSSCESGKPYCCAY